MKDDDRMLRTMAQEAGVDFIEKIADIPGEAVMAVPKRLAYYLSIMPICLDGSELQVALSDPFNFNALDKLCEELCYDIVPIVAPAEQIRAAIARHYGNSELP